jgi:hypothetical protein
MIPFTDVPISAVPEIIWFQIGLVFLIMAFFIFMVRAEK